MSNPCRKSINQIKSLVNKRDYAAEQMNKLDDEIEEMVDLHVKAYGEFPIGSGLDNGEWERWSSNK